MSNLKRSNSMGIIKTNHDLKIQRTQSVGNFADDADYLAFRRELDKNPDIDIDLDENIETESDEIIMEGNFVTAYNDYTDDKDIKEEKKSDLRSRVYDLINDNPYIVGSVLGFGAIIVISQLKSKAN